jgi:hypothetical protein
MAELTSEVVFDRLPKEVQDFIRNAPIQFNLTWHMLNTPKWLILKVLQRIVDEETAKNPPFRPLRETEGHLNLATRARSSKGTCQPMPSNVCSSSDSKGGA